MPFEFRARIAALDNILMLIKLLNIGLIERGVEDTRSNQLNKLSLQT